MTELPYKEISRIIKYRILSGEYPPGQKLSSVRAIAKEMGYNPATVHHSLSCLQQQGFIISRKTVGYFITADKDKLEKLRMEETKNLTSTLYKSLCVLGYSDLEIRKLVQKEC